MDDEEVIRLHEIATQASAMGPLLEIGSYCGRSAAILGWACKPAGAVLYSIDHHRGSEEQQPGQEYFDPDLLDPRARRIDTFPFFRDTVERAGLEEVVIPLVCNSSVAGKMWQTPLSLVFIDGGHSFDAAYTDLLTWSPHVMAGGFLVVHDIFYDPLEGGQAPRQVYEKALETGLYKALEMTKTLGVLQRKPEGK